MRGRGRRGGARGAPDMQVVAEARELHRELGQERRVVQQRRALRVVAPLVPLQQALHERLHGVGEHHPALEEEEEEERRAGLAEQDGRAAEEQARRADDAQL